MAQQAGHVNVPSQDRNHVPNLSGALLQPDGLDSLAGWDKYKVETAKPIIRCSLRNNTNVRSSLVFVFAIENPTNSHYWNVASTLKIRKEFGDSFCHLSCMRSWRHSRTNQTSIWQSQHYFDSLSLKCDRKHSPRFVETGYERWPFCSSPTAEEAAYPHLLCDRIIACVMTQVLKDGLLFRSNPSHKQIELQQSTQQRRIAMGALPRGNKIKAFGS